MPDITPEREHQLRWASEAVYAAGSDTTVSAIRNFVLAMVLNQDSQAKAHAELDAWLGLAELRLPTFEDRPNLPYLDKLLWETLRWYPVVPLGLPHRVIQDDVYEGYRIPKGATVIANIWVSLSMLIQSGN
jgi:cytochrome P450